MLDSPAMRDVLPLILEYISEARDLKSIDCTSLYLHKKNENSGWKTFATEILALPLSFKGDNITWKSFLCTRVRPMYERMSRICSVDDLRERLKRFVSRERNEQRHPELYAKYKLELQQQTFPPCTAVARKVLCKHDWPVDIGIFILCHCYFFSQAPFKKGFFDFDYEDKWGDSTDSFAFWDNFCLGAGDTQWWSYVVLKGSVKVPLAPSNYYRDKTQGEPVEIGRGGIVAFSHWNHGGADTTPRHIYPRWDPTEFGFDECAFKVPCDEWVRANLEEPVQASRDCLPAAWRDIWEFMDELEEKLEDKVGGKEEHCSELQSSSSSWEWSAENAWDSV